VSTPFELNVTQTSSILSGSDWAVALSQNLTRKRIKNKQKRRGKLHKNMLRCKWGAGEVVGKALPQSSDRVPPI